jgi:hypothetical protein
VNFIVFHGTALPDRDWANRVRADVVLQPYHPIVQAQDFGGWFPLARRFVYVNPTVVDPQRRNDVTAEMLWNDPDDAWGLPRLRLPEFLDWAVDDSVQIGRGVGVDGLFVDDLDRLTVVSSHRHLAIDYARRVAEEASCTLYVNRAFEILDELGSLEAVLLEDVDRDLEQPGVGPWLDELVVPALWRARSRGVRLHRLDYMGGGDTRFHAPDPLSGLLTSVARLPEPALDSWDIWTVPA